jgi:heme O synthase-like polyprenyltransferase
MYREDYARGGHAMLPVRDHGGEITAQAIVLSTIPLIPLGASATLLGLAGVWSALVSVLLGAWFLWLAVGFYRGRDDASARRLFLGSITYLPLVLAAMTIDRGSIDATAFIRGRGGVEGVSVAPVESSPAGAPALEHGHEHGGTP